MDVSDIPAICFPLVTKERFAELSGLEVGVVRGMLDRGYLPSCKVGRHRLVNLRELWERCRDGKDVPESGGAQGSIFRGHRNGGPASTGLP